MSNSVTCIEPPRAQPEPGTPTPGGSLLGESLGKSTSRGCLQGSTWPICTTPAPARGCAQRSTSDAWEALQALVSCLSKDAWPQPASPAAVAAIPGPQQPTIGSTSSGQVESFNFRVAPSLEQPRSPVACALPARSGSQGATGAPAAKRKREGEGGYLAAMAVPGPHPKRIARDASISSGRADCVRRQAPAACPLGARAPSPPTAHRPQPAVVPLLLAQRSWERQQAQQQQAAKAAMLLRSRSAPVRSSELEQALVTYSQLWSLKQLWALQQRGRGKQAPLAPTQLPDHIFQVLQKSLGQAFVSHKVATPGMM